MGIVELEIPAAANRAASASGVSSLAVVAEQLGGVDVNRALQVAREVLHPAARVQHEGVRGLHPLGEPVGADEVDHAAPPRGAAAGAGTRRTGLKPAPTGVLRKGRGPTPTRSRW